MSYIVSVIYYLFSSIVYNRKFIVKSLMLIYNEEHLKHILKYLMLIISCNLQIYYILTSFFLIRIKAEAFSMVCVSKYTIRQKLSTT